MVIVFPADDVSYRSESSLVLVCIESSIALPTREPSQCIVRPPPRPERHLAERVDRRQSPALYTDF